MRDMLKIVSGTIILLCLFGVSSVMASEYETYNCDYFSVEYPDDWDVKRTLDTDAEGWNYEFTHYGTDAIDLSEPDINDASVHHIEIIIGAEAVKLYMVSSLDTLTNGSFDEPTHHFLDTLNFTFTDAALTAESQNPSYKSYDGIYFNVEYPLSWSTSKKSPEETNGVKYSFYDRSVTTFLGMGFETIELFDQSLDTSSLYISVPKNSISGGKFGESVQHFLETLHYKV